MSKWIRCWIRDSKVFLNGTESETGILSMSKQIRCWIRDSNRILNCTESGILPMSKRIWCWIRDSNRILNSTESETGIQPMSRWIWCRIWDSVPKSKQIRCRIRDHSGGEGLVSCSGLGWKMAQWDGIQLCLNSKISLSPYMLAIFPLLSKRHFQKA